MRGNVLRQNVLYFAAGQFGGAAEFLNLIHERKSK